MISIEGRCLSEVENFIDSLPTPVTRQEKVTDTGDSSGESSSNTIIVSEEARAKINVLLLHMMGRRPY